MRALGASIAIAVLLLLAAIAWPTRPSGPTPRTQPTAPSSGPGPLPSPTGPGETPTVPAPGPEPAPGEPEAIQVPSQERLTAEIVKALSLGPQQTQRVREVLDRHAKRMTELLHAERDDAFAERLARAKQEVVDDLLSILTAEQQAAFKQTALYRRMTTLPIEGPGR